MTESGGAGELGVGEVARVAHVTVRPPHHYDAIGRWRTHEAVATGLGDFRNTRTCTSHRPPFRKKALGIHFETRQYNCNKTSTSQ